MKQGVRIVREQRFWPSGRFENINVCELGLVLSSACIWQVVQRSFSNFQLAVYIYIYRNILVCVCVLRTLQGSSSPRIVVQKRVKYPKLPTTYQKHATPTSHQLTSQHPLTPPLLLPQVSLNFHKYYKIVL
jgi:hypothetical protein